MSLCHVRVSCRQIQELCNPKTYTGAHDAQLGTGEYWWSNIDNVPAALQLQHITAAVGNASIALIFTEALLNKEGDGDLGNQCYATLPDTCQLPQSSTGSAVSSTQAVLVTKEDHTAGGSTYEEYKWYWHVMLEQLREEINLLTNNATDPGSHVAVAQLLAASYLIERWGHSKVTTIFIHHW